jgi:hypothetical protein
MPVDSGGASMYLKLQYMVDAKNNGEPALPGVALRILIL